MPVPRVSPVKHTAQHSIALPRLAFGLYIREGAFPTLSMTLARAIAAWQMLIAA